MTVAELIERLQRIQDKSRPVILDATDGYGKVRAVDSRMEDERDRLVVLSLDPEDEAG